MKCLPIVLLFLFQVSFGQQGINRIILRAGQKTFLERGDYLQDRVIVTDRVDTVVVVQADASYYKFTKGEYSAWGLTQQVREHDILPNEVIGSDPVQVVTDGPTPVYKEGVVGSNLLVDLKKGELLTIVSKEGVFYEVNFGKEGHGYIVSTAVPGPERDRSKPHIMREALAMPTNTNTGYGSGKSSPSSSSAPTSTQCSGRTKKGARCNNMTTNSSGRCHLH